jgi:hypothetical protein
MAQGRQQAISAEHPERTLLGHVEDDGIFG